ncbi:SAM hydrolase/SAM-dependent halogenase family protein [Kaarinaea lacus]
MIVLFTDFGVSGPYVGQMKAVLHRDAPNEFIVDLFADAPSFDPKLSAYLLAAYIEEFPAGTVFLCVVDPGVGSQTRKPLIAKIEERWFVGPHNGLFNVIAQRAKTAGKTQWWEVTWQPPRLSNSFHGRDLFAPVAAQLVRGKMPQCKPLPSADCLDTTWPEELHKIIYIDSFGNAMTGVRAAQINRASGVKVGTHTLSWARTFSEVPVGSGFWYANANGLVEISVNQGSAKQRFALSIGDTIDIE